VLFCFPAEAVRRIEGLIGQKLQRNDFNDLRQKIEHMEEYIKVCTSTHEICSIRRARVDLAPAVILTLPQLRRAKLRKKEVS
jgi:hypothetical protein